MKVATAFIDYC